MSDKKNMLITDEVGLIGSNHAERLISLMHDVFSIDHRSFLYL